ncbi:response regulator transcription factor [Nocardioides lentus]|uniref:Response regulator transcription factor n=1 Tax=Nocardioides lentus TaxID=338077 RepID=A0ABN2PJ44_9ACTN
MTTVLVVDDHGVVRRGLTGLLDHAEDLEVVAVAADGAAAVELARRHRPDVVLMDLQMPGMDGVEATRIIRDEDLAGDVLVLTSYSDRRRILAALDAGAVGYLLKDTEPDDLVAGVRAVARGESPLDPKAARQLLLSRGDRQEPTLSPREVEVLRLVVQGLANKQIAHRLGIRERTVKQHLTNVFARIGVSDRTQAALWAQRHGW